MKAVIIAYLYTDIILSMPTSAWNLIFVHFFLAYEIQSEMTAMDKIMEANEYQSKDGTTIQFITIKMIHDT